MFGRLVLIFILVPLADLILLLVIADYTGWRFSIAIVVISGVVGAWLARQQSRSVSGKIRQQLQQNQMPTELLTDGAMIFFAAGLLLTPGFITDAVGVTLLIPVCRRWYKRRVANFLNKHFKVKVVSMNPQGNPFQDPDVVEGEVLDSTTNCSPHDELPKL